MIEAVRLAETLAGLRGRPLAGLAEVTDATLAVLCDGDETALRFVTDELVVGQALGPVDPDVPTVPLEADLVATCRTLRLEARRRVKVHDLDLRRPIDQHRSLLFHRLRLLGLGWVDAGRERGRRVGAPSARPGSLAGEPESRVGVVEAAVWGTTVEAAATREGGRRRSPQGAWSS